MFQTDYDMTVSNEDLVVLILGIIALILSFSDIRSSDTLAWISFPALILVIVGWGISRFRLRPLPKQIQYTKSIYLSVIKTLRNYSLFSIIIQNILFLSRYIEPNTEARTILLFNFAALITLEFLEFAGNITVTDTLRIFPLLEGEDEKTAKKKQFQLLFGRSFWIWISITSIISLAVIFLPINSALVTKDALLISSQVVALLLGIGTFLLIYYQTMNFDGVLRADLVIKAVNYYTVIDFEEKGIELLERYLREVDSYNIGILSKLAGIYVKRHDFDKTLATTAKIIKYTTEHQTSTPHLNSRAHLLRAICFKAKEDYEEAYKEVTQSLVHHPENTAARKLRRTLRKGLKATEQIKKSKQ
ncbi:MAG: hypothetical protein KAS95_01600 [Candidatus Heimdallarchaeota archaeon]|nr:hypothetical protein [Candidatus Heimdallarchaeota archaeon]